VGPWLDKVWPKDLNMRDPDSSLSLAMAATYAGASFEAAVNVIAPLLVGAKHCLLLWKRLLDTGLAASQPASVLTLAGRIVDTAFDYPDPFLRKLLEAVREADPRLADRKEFLTLDTYLRQHNL